MTARMRSPDFVCIGAQKAGTTWLHQNLSAHPGIWLHPVKELHYFDRLYCDEPGYRDAVDVWLGRRAGRMLSRSGSDPAAGNHLAAEISAIRLAATAPISDEWYMSMFGLAPTDSVCGEITPAYAVLPPEGVDHLLALAPDVKILFLLRDPIERAWSAMRMRNFRSANRPERVGRSGEPDGRRKRLSPPSRYSMAGRSRYSITLGIYRARIEESRIWIGDFEQLSTDPKAFLRGVCAFLEVEFDERLFPRMDERIYEGAPTQMDEDVYQRLKANLEPEYDELCSMLPELAGRWKRRHYG